MKRITFLLSLLLSIKATSQNVTIDYEAWNPAGTNCRLFDNATNVPAAGTASGTIAHQRQYGQIIYDNSDQALQIKTEYQTTGAVYKGGRYVISNNFKSGYTYTIYVTAAANENTSNSGPFIKVGISNISGSNGGSGCDGPQSADNNAGGNPAGVKLSSNSFQEFQFPFPPLAGNQPSLEVSAIPETNGGTKTVRIKKIRIVEKAPPPTFTLTPSSLSVPCGSTAPQLFKVTNVYNSPGTWSYSWDLGSSNNGWIYNGNPAPQIIPTTSDNISLTPSPTATSLSNVMVTVSNMVPYTILRTIVSFTNPTYLISGPEIFCTTGTYTIAGLPSGTTVNWSSSDPSIVSISANGTATKLLNGSVKISAAVSLPNVCNGTVIPKDILAGTPTPAGINGPDHALCYNGRLSEIGTFYVANPISFSGLTYAWQIDGISTGAGTSIRVDPFRWGTGVNEIRVRSYSAACGNSAWYTSSFVIIDCSSMKFSVSPNPAHSNILVSVINSDRNISKPNEIQSIELIDKMGNIRYLIKPGRGVQTMTIPVVNFPNDIYTVKIFDGKIWHARKIIIQH